MLWCSTSLASSVLSTPTITRLTMPSMLRRRGGGLSHVNIVNSANAGDAGVAKGGLADAQFGGSIDVRWRRVYCG